MLRLLTGTLLAAVNLNEGVRTVNLHRERTKVFEAAQKRAADLARPLVVVGDPDAGMATRMKRAYSCGDVCVDLSGCPACPVSMSVDITAGIPSVPDDSAVVFVSCVLEYTDDPEAALKDLRRVAGAEENLFLVTVDPSTLTSFLYPGARWRYVDGKFQPVSNTTRVALGAGMVAASAAMLFARRKGPGVT